MDYLQDEIAVKCLDWALESKAKVGFGAVLLDQRGSIAGEGRNRRSNYGENDLLGGGVDYRADAEQAAVIHAVRRGYPIPGSELYVIGVVMKGDKRGFWSVRPSDKDKYFSCVRCAKMMVRFGISVNIPLPSGWYKLSAEEALDTAKELKAQDRKLEFSRPPIKL